MLLPAGITILTVVYIVDRFIDPYNRVLIPLDVAYHSGMISPTVPI